MPNLTMMRRRLAVLTVGRSDWGIYETLLHLIREDPDLDLQLLAMGAHFDPRFGETIREVERQGFEYEANLKLWQAEDTPQEMGAFLGHTIEALAGIFARKRPDLLIVLGDRSEMICGPVAAMNFKLPVAHLHGGAVTEGAVDELVRHAITKMSHLHFVSCEPYAQRVRQMGEEAWRVLNCGAPGLDRFLRQPRLSRGELASRLGLNLSEPFLLVTFHPVTLELEQRETQVQAMLAALERSGLRLVITYPNNDIGNAGIIERLEAFGQRFPERVALLRFAGTLYPSLLAEAAAMVGNSSSGIVEAPSFRLPVVNLGTRQAGKLHPENVVTVEPQTEAIFAAIQQVIHPEFRQKLQNFTNPYGDGQASERILGVLKTIPLDERLLRKKFIDASS